MFTRNDLRRTRYYQEVREEVRQEEALELIRRLLIRRIGAVNPLLQERLHQLSIAQLEDLAEALLDFSSEADLVAWLNQLSNQSESEGEN